MPIANEPNTILDNGWIIRAQAPRVSENPRMLLLLHGWTGDETVMWIFARNLPPNTWIAAPRGPVKAPESGYGWLPHGSSLPRLADFNEVTAALMQEIDRWAASVRAPSILFDVMGFSQGAAMAYALAANYPQRVNRLVVLAGFLPADEDAPGRYNALDGKKIYIAHGTKDETVPVALAQQAVQTLQSAGAQVTYCESEVGHKLSAACLRGLEAFLG